MQTQNYTRKNLGIAVEDARRIVSVVGRVADNERRSIGIREFVFIARKLVYDMQRGELENFTPLHAEYEAERLREQCRFISTREARRFLRYVGVEGRAAIFDFKKELESSVLKRSEKLTWEEFSAVVMYAIKKKEWENAKTMLRELENS